MESTDEVIVKKCGIRLKPAAVVAYYELSSTSTAAAQAESGEKPQRRLRERVMPLRNFCETSDVSEVTAALRERHRHVLGHVSIVQLERLVRIVQLKLEGFELDDCVARARRQYDIDPDEDLNKVDAETLQRKKQIMDETFVANQKKPGDDDFQYDVQVNFPDVGSVDDLIETSGWDSDNNDSIF